MMAGRTPAVLLYGPLRYARLRFAAGRATAALLRPHGHEVLPAVERELPDPHLALRAAVKLEVTVEVAA